MNLDELKKLIADCEKRKLHVVTLMLADAKALVEGYQAQNTPQPATYEASIYETIG